MSVNDIYNSDLDRDFSRFSKIYEEAINDLNDACRDDATSKHAYELAHAKAYLNATGTIPEREAQTRIATDRERLATLIADGKREATRARVKWVDKELSILQTRAANLRSEMEMAGNPQPR
jgi:hypothetical protein